jgi:hypothetical protein
MNEPGPREIALAIRGIRQGQNADHRADVAIEGKDRPVAFEVVNSLPTATPFSLPIVTPLGVLDWAYPRSA